MKEFQLFINGGYQPAKSGKTVEDINPATGAAFAEVHQADSDDALQALDCAEQAYQDWRNILPSEREAIFLQAAELLRQRAEAFKDVLIDEGGATPLKANYEVHHTALHMRSIAGECRRVTGDTFNSEYPGVKSYCIRRPLGIVLAISPFNFPLLLSNRKIGWAMAAGNCVILKPSEVTPVIGLMLGELYRDAGVPPGVLNVIPAQGSDLGDTLIADARVKKIAFTGSSRVGKALAAKAAAYNKKYTLEMGGKNPLIILRDADPDYAVNVATFSNYMNQGQVCMTGSRVIVEAPIYDDFCDRFAAKVATLKVGNPRDPGVIIGPLIRDTQPAFIQQQVDAAVADGARLLTGGGFEGSYYNPTVVADVTPDMGIFRTECFGPVAAVIKADDHQQALALANDSDYGLSAAVLTNDLEKAIVMSEALETGMVHINGPTIRDEPTAPFGGVKDSGAGREGGRYSMEDFTELKWVTIQTGQQKFPF